MTLASTLGVLVAGGAARAEPARVACRATLANGRALVSLDLRDFFDKEMLRLVRLGLEGRIHIDVALVRPRRLWFHARLATDSKDIVVTYVRSSGKFLLDGGGLLPDPGAIALERWSLWLGEGTVPGAEYVVEVKARLQVVTASSLGKVASWIAGGDKGDAPAARSTLSRNLLTTLANDLIRSATASCKATPPT